MTYAIELRNIRKSFFENRVLRGLSLQLEGGHFHALIGRNGVGKSTLLKILARHLAPEAGDGHVLGIPLSRNDAQFNAQVMFVNETVQYRLPYSMADFFPEIGRLYPRWDAGIFKRMMEDRGLDPHKRFGTLSRGQRMQVALAAALAVRPGVLLLDEVTSVLDAGARFYYMNVLDEFVKAGGTVVMSTNIVSEVHPLAARLIFLEDGDVKLLSTLAEISAKFQRLKRARRQSHPVFDDAACVEIGISDADELIYLLPVERLAAFRVDAPLLDTRKATAEDVFIYYTKGRSD